MKKTIMCVTGFLFIALYCMPSIAGQENFMIAKSNPDKITFWNKITDSIAVVGKSDNEKNEILRHRKELRRKVRLIEDRQQKDVATKKRMIKQQNEIMKKIQAGEGY